MNTRRHTAAIALAATLLTAAAAVTMIATPADAAPDTPIELIGGPSVMSEAVLDHLETCTNAPITRVAGPNRYATAALVSQRSFPSADKVYIATGENFPDALAAGPVAAADGAPILLVRHDSVPHETVAELDRLSPSSIVILGGSAAVSDAVEAWIHSRHQAADVERIAGAGRYETAALVSASHFNPGVPRAYVTVGTNFPDALSGGVAAGVAGAPIVLTGTHALPPATAAELTRLQPEEIVVLGGTAVVSAGVENELAPYTVGNVRRLAGGSRFGTAAAIAADTFTGPVAKITIATGLDFPDALAATPSADGPLLLASEHAVHSSTAGAIARLTGMPCSEFEEDLGPILAIGDSVMAGAVPPYWPNLESQIPDLTANAKVSRQFSEAKAIVASALARSNPPKIVVIHLGTNGPPTPAQFTDLMTVAKDVPRVLFLTVKVSRSWESTTNAVLRTYVPLYDNTELVDWWALASAHPDWFSTDTKYGAHLWKEVARRAYVDLIEASVAW